MKIDVDRTVGDFPIAGKVVLVTGGGSGISLAFSRLALDAGAKVIIADIKLSTEAQTLIDSAGNNNVIFQQTDVSDWSQLQRLITVSREKFGTVPDVYMAGAGIFEPPSSNFWADTETDGRFLTLDINAGHIIKLARIALRTLVGANKQGVYLSIASMAGIRADYSSPLYCASKYAVVGMTRSLVYADMLEGVKFCAVCPGLAETPLISENKRQELRMNEKPTMLKAEDIASAMMALVQEGRYKGGTVMSMNLGSDGVVVDVEAQDGKYPIPTLQVGEDIPAYYQRPKECMDKERGNES